MNWKQIADALDAGVRNGADKDEPEGSRYIQLSDTLAREMSASLRAEQQTSLAEDGVRIWCGCCGDHQPFEIEPLCADDLNPGEGPWGDVICRMCHSVVLTITAPEPGHYALLRVGD